MSDAVKRQARLIVAEPDRRVAAEDVDAMAARGERLAELGRHDPAAADRGVADDADVHRAVFRRLSRTIGSRTTMPSAQRDAGERAELRVAALDQLPEQRRVQPRADRRRPAARELAGVAIERARACVS